MIRIIQYNKVSHRLVTDANQRIYELNIFLVGANFMFARELRIMNKELKVKT